MDVSYKKFWTNIFLLTSIRPMPSLHLLSPSFRQNHLQPARTQWNGPSIRSRRISRFISPRISHREMVYIKSDRRIRNRKATSSILQPSNIAHRRCRPLGLGSTMRLRSHHPGRLFVWMMTHFSLARKNRPNRGGGDLLFVLHNIGRKQLCWRSRDSGWGEMWIKPDFIGRQQRGLIVRLIGYGWFKESRSYFRLSVLSLALQFFLFMYLTWCLLYIFGFIIIF